MQLHCAAIIVSLPRSCRPHSTWWSIRGGVMREQLGLLGTCPHHIMEKVHRRTPGLNRDFGFYVPSLFLKLISGC